MRLSLLSRIHRGPDDLRRRLQRQILSDPAGHRDPAGSDADAGRSADADTAADGWSDAHRQRRPRIRLHGLSEQQQHDDDQGRRHGPVELRGHDCALDDLGNLLHGQRPLGFRREVLRLLLDKFTQPGTFPYFCTVHGAMMTGTVVVN